MGYLGGALLILGIVLVAGFVAYIGDRVGHQVGRKRMTLFGLRPKYTSTIVAVATGMTIALVVTGTALLASGYARAAFFHLSEINNRVNSLEAQAQALDRARNSNIIIARGQPLSTQFLLLSPDESKATQFDALSSYFTAVVSALNRRYVPLGLRPDASRAADPTVAAELHAVLDDQTTQGFLLRGKVLLVAVADYNLFVNDRISFTFAPYADQIVFHARQPITSIEIEGGTAINPNFAYGQLVSAVRQIAIERGMPAFAATVIPTLTTAEVTQTSRDIHAGHGRFYIVANATTDVFPHTGDVPIAFTLRRRPR